jgi:hypothetical protein
MQQIAGVVSRVLRGFPPKGYDKGSGELSQLIHGQHLVERTQNVLPPPPTQYILILSATLPTKIQSNLSTIPLKIHQ